MKRWHDAKRLASLASAPDQGSHSCQRMQGYCGNCYLHPSVRWNTPAKASGADTFAGGTHRCCVSGWRLAACVCASLAARIVWCAWLAIGHDRRESPAMDAKPAAVASDCARARAFEPFAPSRGRPRVTRSRDSRPLEKGQVRFTAFHTLFKKLRV